MCTLLAQEIGTLDSLYLANSWEKLDQKATQYMVQYPEKYQGHYFKAIAKHELQFYDSALYFLDAGKPFVQPENLLRFTTAYGSVYTSKNELSLADSMYTRAEAMIAESTHKDIYSLYDLWAENRWFAGQPFESEALLRKGLAYLEEEDVRLRGRVSNNLGIVNWELGKFNESLNYLKDAEKFYRQEFGDEDVRIAKALNNQGVVYLDLGDNKKAEYHFKLAREIQKRVYEGNAPDAYMTYNNLAHIALRQGDFKQAYAMASKSLEILNKAEGGAVVRMIEPYEVQAAVWRELGDNSAATDILETGIDLLSAVDENHSGLIPLYQQMAEVLLETGSFQEAYDAISHAVYLFTRSNSAQHPKLGELYALHAQICLQLKLFEEAEDLAEKAMQVFSTQVNPTQESPLNLQSYRVSKGLVKAAEAMGDVYLAMDDTEKALQVWNLGLDCVDQLRTMTAYIQSRIELYKQAESLNTKYVVLLLELNEAGARNEKDLLRAMEHGKAFSLNLKSEPDDNSQLRNELMTQRAYWERVLYDLSDEKKTRQAQMELVLIDTRLDSLKTEHYAQFSSQFLDQVIQMSYQAAFLSFFNRDTLTIGAVVAEGEIRIHRLNGRHLAEDIAAFKRSYTDLDYILGHPHEADSSFALGSENLYNKLIGPCEQYLKVKNNWYISADNLLLDLHFGLLGKADSHLSVDYQTYPYLLRDHSISYLPSLNLAGKSRHIASQGFSVWNFNEDSSDNFAGEANTISEFFDVDLFEGVACSESKFKSLAHESSLIHIGCHGETGESPFDTKIQFARDSLNDGELTYAEVGWMQLATELVTLSACKTGSGKSRAGEWTQSVAYGFISAGCPTVISSSWNIPDDATQQVMSRFYENLSIGNSSLNSLRQAQMSVLEKSDKLHAHPFYWAGMVHQGNEVSIEPTRSQFNWKFWGLLGVVFLVLVWLRSRSKNQS